MDVKTIVFISFQNQTYIAGIRYDDDENCKAMLRRLCDRFLAANVEALHEIADILENAGPKKISQRRRGVRKQLHNAIAKYLWAIREQFEIKNLLTQDNPSLSCSTVMQNDDCTLNALTEARMYVTRSRRIYGFSFFRSAPDAE